MAYVIANGKVRRQYMSVSGRSVIGKYVGLEKIKRIVPSASSVVVDADLEISLASETFDAQSGDYVTDVADNSLISVTCAGISEDVQLTDGLGTFQFSSAEAGTFNILCEGAETVEVTVI